MSASGLSFCMAIQRAHASLQRRFDDALGTHYGIDFCDFALLDWLASMPACQASFVECAQSLGLPGPAVLKRVLALEKIGLIAREGTRHTRRISLRPAARALVNNARETVGWICGNALADIAPASIPSTEASLHAFANAHALPTFGYASVREQASGANSLSWRQVHFR